MRHSQNHIALAPREECTGCEACASSCPKECISFIKDREGFLQPKIDKTKCTSCGKCKNTCPVINPEQIDDTFETKACVAFNLDEKIRMNSTSGGLFYALAEWTIKHDGVVFGACFNEEWEVIHSCTDELEGVIGFMGSKYVQSRINGTFSLVKKYLEDGRWVLFSGTPCQLGGLRAYLGKDYTRLIQVDIICHGVPSPRVWHDFLREDYADIKTINHISFRSKLKGWKGGYRMVVEETNESGNRSYHLYDNNSLFLKGFSYNFFLRTCCYNCRFKTIHRNSDLTIADAWGIEYFAPELDDNKGTSLVLVHTDTGAYLLEQISQYISIKKDIEINQILKYNRRLNRSVPSTQYRNVFF